MSKEIYKKWTESGFLEGIDGEEDRLKLSLYFEDLTTYFNNLTEGNDASNLELEVASFPIAIRVFQLTDFKYDRHPAEFIQEIFNVECSMGYHKAITDLTQEMKDTEAFRLVYIANEIANDYGK